MRFLAGSHLVLGLLRLATAISPDNVQEHLDSKAYENRTDVSPALFSSLERMSRLVDITYCVGTTGVSKPFSCVSRCRQFPTLNLVTTWHTGLLITDSCGYIAVDHGEPRSDADDSDGGDYIGEREIVVAFRGTYSITNTIVDLSTIPQEYVPYPSPDHGGEEPPREPEHECHNCTVHMGFLASWRSARDVVLPTLTSLRHSHPDYRIHLVGHSLGGAVAALAALELRVSLEWDNIKVTTFGEPRVGNAGLAKFIDEVFYLEKAPNHETQSYRRVTHINDPVPLLPLGEWGFRPHAGEIFISKADLPPSIQDLQPCAGDSDPACIGGSDSSVSKAMLDRLIHDEETEEQLAGWAPSRVGEFPPRLKLWQLFFAHRDYFWRLGLCVPGGDPKDWGRDKYDNFPSKEL